MKTRMRVLEIWLLVAWGLSALSAAGSAPGFAPTRAPTLKGDDDDAYFDDDEEFDDTIEQVLANVSSN